MFTKTHKLLTAKKPDYSIPIEETFIVVSDNSFLTTKETPKLHDVSPLAFRGRSVLNSGVDLRPADLPTDTLSTVDFAQSLKK